VSVFKLVFLNQNLVTLFVISAPSRSASVAKVFSSVKSRRARKCVVGMQMRPNFSVYLSRPEYFISMEEIRALTLVL